MRRRIEEILLRCRQRIEKCTIYSFAHLSPAASFLLDPHFKTWGGIGGGNYYDYHGGCDLVLIKNAFLQLHIRTVPTAGFSFISAAALQIGGSGMDKFEVDASSGTATTLLNAVNIGPAPTGVVLDGTYPVTVTPQAYGTTWEVDLSPFAPGEKITIGDYGGSIFVNAQGHSAGGAFTGSLGMSGKFPNGELYDRNGAGPALADGAAMATEWQVDNTSSGPQFDATLLSGAAVLTCTPPMTYNSCIPDPAAPPMGEPVCCVADAAGQGTTCANLMLCPPAVAELCEPGKTMADVAAACADITVPELRENCEYDVMVTGDPSYADAPWNTRSFELPCPTAGCNGDPHFTMWHGEKFDYHGQCDLELVSDPSFADGKGLMVYIKTEIVRSWSYVTSAAIRIGEDILEVKGGMDDSHYWFNKNYQGKLTTMGGFPVKYKKANSKSHSYIIDLGSKEDKIEIRTYKELVRIDFKKAKKELYKNTVGLLGDYATGKKLARDGFTVIEDDNEFGQEWQVLPGSPQLFHDVSGPQAPFEKCVLPDKNQVEKERRRRRLGKAKVTKSEAESACEQAGVSESDHKNCVADVLAMDDVDVAESY